MKRTVKVVGMSFVSCVLVMLGAGVGTASPATVQAATVTGAPALIIVLVILALIIIGAVAVIRFIVGKGKNVL